MQIIRSNETLTTETVKAFAARCDKATKTSRDDLKRAVDVDADHADLGNHVAFVARSDARFAAASLFVTLWDNSLKSDAEALPEHLRLFRIREYMHARLYAGPNDTWSGRGNDLARSYFDGYREAVIAIVRAIDDQLADEPAWKAFQRGATV